MVSNKQVRAADGGGLGRRHEQAEVEREKKTGEGKRESKVNE